MTLLLILVFWLAAFLVVYPYLVYPPVLAFLARTHPAPAATTLAGSAEDLPFVTLVVSAFNEEAVLPRKLENSLAIDWPADRFEVLVVSDASTDRTDEIVREAGTRDPRVLLLRQDERRGKSAGLNKAVAAARGELIVFSDANAMYEPDAVRYLAAAFADPAVGYVVGAALYHDPQGNRAAESEGLYWKLEMTLKRLESAFDSVVGGDGAIYAIRRSLFWELQDDDISDFVNPLLIVAAGHRGLFEPRAKCWEHAGDRFEKEFGRKRRIVNRTWRAFRRYGGRLDQGRHPRFLFMLWSHKVIRWFAAPLIAVAWIANTFLLGKGGLYALTWATIALSVVLAWRGRRLEARGRPLPKPVALLYYFYAVNLAGILGIWDEARGVRHATWDHIRKEAP